MRYVDLPEGDKTMATDYGSARRLSFYLSMEEYLTRVVRHGENVDSNMVADGDRDLFFMWQVCPSVIYGRNQLLENEVDLDYCKTHGIEVFQRKSGGGCVYADMGNLMLSYVTCEKNVNMAFYTFINMLLLVLRKMGVEGVSTKNNDVLLPVKESGDAEHVGNQQWRKVSGTACHYLHDCSIVHGTLLYDTDMENMLHAITPSAEKLQKKGIQSVRQRITFLRDYVSLSLDEVKTVIRDTLCNGSLTLTTSDVEEIERLEQELFNLNSNKNYGNQTRTYPTRETHLSL